MIVTKKMRMTWQPSRDSPHQSCLLRWVHQVRLRNHCDVDFPHKKTRRQSWKGIFTRSILLLVRFRSTWMLVRQTLRKRRSQGTMTLRRSLSLTSHRYSLKTRNIMKTKTETLDCDGSRSIRTSHIIWTSDLNQIFSHNTTAVNGVTEDIVGGMKSSLRMESLPRSCLQTTVPTSTPSWRTSSRRWSMRTTSASLSTSRSTFLAPAPLLSSRNLTTSLCNLHFKACFYLHWCH